MVQTAITEAITSLAVAEQRLQLQAAEAADFFPEWQLTDAALSAAEQDDLADLRRRYLYHWGTGNLSEGLVMLLVVAPLLAIAGFYDPPFRVTTESAVSLTLDDSEVVLRGRLDALIVQGNLWVVVVESKKTALSVWTALPQTLAYLAAAPAETKPRYGLITNGDDFVFVKCTGLSPGQYGLSRVFSLQPSSQDLRQVLGILKQLGQTTAAAPAP